MQSYEEAISEAVQLLISHGEHRGPVTEHFYDRLRSESDLQQVLLGERLPDNPEEANRIIRERGVEAVHKLMHRASKRLNSAHRAPE